ncbi:sensor histidine kinase [Leptolyngbya sp. NIES-2104]|uniref:sensor histidine kinase n=1 Tax=Leptolyngbya sp. NIES-2104 TaxID=1552121 RepID=UPI0006EC434F|nr:MASE1 domain-containing protein [Leptolyngbya sp. NIES-2104]GAP95387.1 circadian input kinase A / phytochrome-like protein [Leptolyngbya sp. NIES-2104]
MWLKQTQWVPTLFAIALVAIVYFVSAKLAFTFVQLDAQAQASVLYPPAGIALAAVMLLERFSWIGVFVGATLFGRSLDGVSWITAIVAGLGSTLEVLVAVGLLKRLGFRRSLRRVRDVLAFASIGAVLAPSLNATISTINGYLAGIVPSAEISGNWMVIWLGDAVSILVLTPAIVVWGSRSVQIPRSWSELRREVKKALLRQRVIEFAVWLGLIVMSSWMILNSPLAQVPTSATGTMATIRGAVSPILQYSPFLFIVWSALRLGQRGTVVCLLIASFVSIWGVSQNYRYFGESNSETLQNALFQIQIFIGVMATIALVLAAAIAERHQVESLLRQRIEQDQFLAESTLRIRRSLDVKEVLNTTVAEVRSFLNADRVYISVFDEQGFAEMVAESVAPQWSPMLGTRSPRPILPDIQQVFTQTPIRVNPDSEKTETSEFLQIYYRMYQIKASIGIPIYQDGRLFGVLNVDQCGAPRQWRSFEVELLERLATQVELALQQGRLYEKVQGFAADLETQVQDRTAELQQRMLELQSLNQVKDTLVHAVTHDLRTPVIGMLMVLKRLQSKAEDTISLSRSTLDRIVDSSNRQLELISSLLEDYSHEPQKVVISPQSISCSEMVSQTLAELEPLLSQNRIHLNNQIPDNLPLISADPTQFRRVLDHLITNAIKHNPPEITLTLRAEEVGAEVKCTIADNGVGISPDQCHQLFRKPYLRGSQNQHRTGLGLGLFLCHQIIAGHRGQIEISSKLDQGTAVWFSLPIA